MQNQDRYNQQNPSFPQGGVASTAAFNNFSVPLQNNPSILPNQSSYIFGRTAREQTMNDPIDNEQALKTLYSNQKFQTSYEVPVQTSEEYKVNQHNLAQQKERANAYQQSYSPSVQQNNNNNYSNQNQNANIYEQQTQNMYDQQNIYEQERYNNAGMANQYELNSNSTYEQPPLPNILHAQSIPNNLQVIQQQPIITKHVRSYSYELPPIPTQPSPPPPQRVLYPPPLSQPPMQFNSDNRDQINYLNASVREYQEKCEQYQFQLTKLREFIREQDNIISSKMSLVDTVQSEVNLLRGEYDKVFSDLIHYKDTLRKMYVLYMDQEQFINDLKLNNTDLVIGIDRQGGRNIELMDEVKNLLSDKEMLRFRMQENQKKTEFDVESMKKQLQSRDDDISSLRRKFNNVIETKRRTEEDKDQKDFELEHLRNRVNTETKEKEVNQMKYERLLEKEREENRKIINDLNQKVHILQIEANKLFDDNKNYVRELQSLTRDLKNKEFDIQKVHSNKLKLFLVYFQCLYYLKI